VVEHPGAPDLHDVMCSAPACVQLALGLLDGVPYCADCAEQLIERAIAVHEAPSLRQTLPPLWGR